MASDRLTLPALMPVLTQRHGVWVTTESDAGDERVRPVVIPEPADYRDGQCASVLAPLYHGESQVSSGFEPRWRDAYRNVNRRFAQEIASLAAARATIWIHDYHLQLVPGYLRKNRPDLQTGFFLHSPFPPAELFLRLPARTEIISGLLGADLVAFQQQRSATNFLEIVGYLTDLPTGDDYVDVDGRTLHVATMPMPTDVTDVERLADDRSVRRRAEEVREALHSPRTVFLSVAGWDHADGIELQLCAFEQLLTGKHLDPATTALVLVAPARPRTSAQQRLRERVERQIARINGKHSRVGRCPVHYLHRDIPTTELVALYQAADVMLATPLQGPATPAAKEFVAARTDDSGYLLLSEFAGVASELPQAHVVNPHDTAAFVHAMATAARHSQTASTAMRSMRQQRNGCVRDWANQFLSMLRTHPRAQIPVAAGTRLKPDPRRHAHGGPASDTARDGHPMAATHL